MGDRPGDARETIEALAVKRDYPRFDVTINVRLRRIVAGGELTEELTVTENLGQGGAKILTSQSVLGTDVMELEEIDGPFQTRVRVLEVLQGSDNVARLNVEFIGAHAPDAARELLRRVGILSAAGQVTLKTEIDVPGIDEAIKTAFEGVSGSWEVELSASPAFNPPWWLMTVEGHDAMFRMSFRPAEQNPQFVHDCMKEALRRRKLIA